METPRDNLLTDKLYFDSSRQMYFVTPDGIGCFWYDTEEEAREQHGFEEDEEVEEIDRLSDF